jgi:hypothetical protein
MAVAGVVELDQALHHLFLGGVDVPRRQILHPARDGFQVGERILFALLAFEEPEHSIK